MDQFLAFRWQRFYGIVLSILILMLGLTCVSGPSHSIKAMQKEDIIGQWKLTKVQNCSQPFPTTIHFLSNGIYDTKKMDPSTYTIWDVGSYELHNSDTLSLSCANDEIVHYSVILENLILTIEDSKGCIVQYRLTSS